jgi:hypothetical protein
LARRKFFDEEILNKYQVLTSKDIQEQYLTVCRQLKRIVNIHPEWDCTEPEKEEKKKPREKRKKTQEDGPKLPEKTPIIPVENGQRKEKKRKEKENKENESESKSGENAKAGIVAVVAAHESFSKLLLSPERAADFKGLHVQVRCLKIPPEWIQLFNNSILPPNKGHKEYAAWFSHLRNWLTRKLPELQEEQARLKKIKDRF